MGRYHALTVRPENSYTQEEVERDTVLKSVSLTPYVEEGEERVCLVAKIDGEPEVAICALTVGRCESLVLNMPISKGTKVTLAVEGKSDVDALFYEMSGSDLSEDDLSEAEASESEEEVEGPCAGSSNKRKDEEEAEELPDVQIKRIALSEEKEKENGEERKETDRGRVGPSSNAQTDLVPSGDGEEESSEASDLSLQSFSVTVDGTGPLVGRRSLVSLAYRVNRDGRDIEEEKEEVVDMLRIGMHPHLKCFGEKLRGLRAGSAVAAEVLERKSDSLVKYVVSLKDVAGRRGKEKERVTDHCQQSQ